MKPVIFVISESPKLKICGDKFKAVDNMEAGLDEGLEAGLELDLDLGILPPKFAFFSSKQNVFCFCFDFAENRGRGKFEN